MTRSKLYYSIWTIAFGVALAIGGSFLEIWSVPFLNVTVATFWVVVLVTLNKVILYKPLSVTHMYVVASLIAIFTPYLGPPSPLKPIVIIAGFLFDAATRFRTSRLTLVDVVLGHLALTISGFSLVWVIFRVHLPNLAESLIPIFMIGSVSHFIVSVLVSGILFKLIRPTDPPETIKRIRDKVRE